MRPTSTAYPLIDPVLIGDIDGSGGLSPADSTAITQETQFILSGRASLDRVEIPAIPTVAAVPTVTAATRPVEVPPPAPQLFARTAAPEAFASGVGFLSQARTFDDLGSGPQWTAKVSLPPTSRSTSLSMLRIALRELSGPTKS
jgi:hypothetical protein